MGGRRNRGADGLSRLVAGALLGIVLAQGLTSVIAQQSRPDAAGGTPAAGSPDASTAPTPSPAPTPTVTPGAGESPVTTSASPPTSPPTLPMAERAPKPEPAPVVLPLTPPTDPVAAKAYSVLETHCARCHQGGRLKRPAPAGGFGNILRLDALAADPVLVRPGNPDGSRLYTSIVRRLMPFDVHQEQSGGPEPSPEDVQAVRAWISGLPAAKGCPERRTVTSEDIAGILTKAGERASWDAGRQRFISLAHLYNACQDADKLAASRESVTRLFNSLSWKPAAIAVHPVDELGVLLRVDLADLGWVPAHWERIVRSGGNAAGRLAFLPAAVRQVFGTDVPAVRADWLANAVLKAPLYYDLLALPLIGSEIQKILQVDADAFRRAGNVQRMAVKPSAFARGGRLIERFPTPRGAAWITFDAVPRDGQRDPGEAAATPTVPGHDASLVHFSLPNGLPGFYALNPRGELIDRVPPDVARRSSAGRTGVRAGIDCMACHGSGTALLVEDGKSAVGIWAQALGDRTATRAGLSNAGVLPDRLVEGVEPLTALVRQYTRPLTLERAAAELLLPAAALEQLPGAASAATQSLVRSLTQGLVSRSDFETGFPQVLEAIGVAAATVAKPLPSAVVAEDTGDPEIAIELLADKPVYTPGDALGLTVKTSTDCYLTVVSIDQRGRGTVIFPSDFEQNNYISAGRLLRLPGESAPYIFRLRERGRETVTAICSPSGGSIDGIKHDFERQRFTDLGDYATFLMQAATAESLERKGQKASSPDPRAKARLRNPRDRLGASDVKPKAETVMRTGITVDIR